LGWAFSLLKCLGFDNYLKRTETSAQRDAGSGSGISLVFSRHVGVTQLFNLYAKALEESFEHNEGYTSVDNLLSNGNYMRIITFLYTVEFPPNST